MNIKAKHTNVTIMQ